MPTLELGDGRKLVYRDEGSGPTLVLVHGSPADSRAWARVAPHLKDRFRLLMPDLPGYGGSDKVADEPRGRAALMGAAVARLIATCEAPVGLAGHSYGGVVALQAAVQSKPGAVDRIMVMEPPFFAALQLTHDPTLDAATEYFEDYCKRVEAREDGAVRQMIDFWFGAGAYTRMAEPVRGFLNANAARNALDVRSAFNDTITAAELGGLKQPVTWTCGENSPDVVQAIAGAASKLLPNARIHTLAGANHGMIDTHAEAVARLIAPG